MECRLIPDSSAATKANGLKDEPACVVAWVALLYWLLRKSCPPYMASTAPVPGWIETSAIRKLLNGAFGVRLATASTAAC